MQKISNGFFTIAIYIHGMTLGEGIRKLGAVVRTVMVAACAATLAGGTAAKALRHDSPTTIHFFTHGDTRFAQFDENRNVTGKIADLLACASGPTGLTFEFEFAPLSRATSMLNTQDHMMWFPSGPNDNPEQQRRMVGPLGVVDILWYQRKSDAMDVTSDAFMQQAKVSAYKGSIFEDILRRDGYNFVEGSADHNRIMYTLLTGEVDAVLAVDFRFKLPDETQQMMASRVQTTLRSQVPVFLTLSRHLANEHPALADDLMRELNTCNAEVSAR